MPTAVIIEESDEEAHLSHPDKDDECFCGESYTDPYKVISIHVYVDHLEENLAQRGYRTCEECRQTAEEWAAPGE